MERLRVLAGPPEVLLQCSYYSAQDRNVEWILLVQTAKRSIRSTAANIVQLFHQ